MDKSLGNGNIEEFFLIDLKERSIRLFIKFKICFIQGRKKISNCNF